MALELLRGAAPPGECSYLPAETASLEYRYLLDIAPAEFEAMLSRGWRRQGACFFRPRCPRCVKCRSLRVDTAAFAPNKSQRRALKKNDGVRLVIRKPSLTKEHLAVFDAYHADMHERRGWTREPTSAEEYSRTFLAGHFSFAKEFLYLRGKELIGVGLVDVTPSAMSSIYFYHRPDWRPDGPGTFSAMKELEYAKQTGRRWLYLGYWIAENASMRYKSNFGPHEILDRYVGDGETPVWRASGEEGLTQRREGAKEENACRPSEPRASRGGWRGMHGSPQPLPDGRGSVKSREARRPCRPLRLCECPPSFPHRHARPSASSGFPHPTDAS